MYWWIWMLAGIGAFWCIFAAICTPLFIIGGFIALKKGRWDLHDEAKAQTAEDFLPTSEADVADEIKDPLASEQAGENGTNDVTNRK